MAEDLSKAKSELKQTTLKKDISNASSNVARAIGSLFSTKDQHIIEMLNKQIIEKDNVIDTLKKTICANEILIQTEKDKVDSAREELRNFKQEIEHWYPGICVNVDFANRCSKSYRIKDEIIKQLLNGKRVVCSGQFRPMGEKVPFELDNAVFSSKITSKDHRTLLINGELVADIIKNRREQWNLERKMKEAMERAQRVSSGMRM